MEILEIENHPFYVGVQFHPEYLSRPLRPSPPFVGLLLASIGELDLHLSSLAERNRAANSNGELPCKFPLCFVLRESFRMRISKIFNPKYLFIYIN